MNPKYFVKTRWLSKWYEKLIRFFIPTKISMNKNKKIICELWPLYVHKRIPEDLLNHRTIGKADISAWADELYLIIKTEMAAEILDKKILEYQTKCEKCGHQQTDYHHVDVAKLYPKISLPDNPGPIVFKSWILPNDLKNNPKDSDES